MDIANLESLDLSDNLLSGLPDLTSLSNLALADVSNNALTFESLEPNVGLPDFRYDNQAEIGQELADSIAVPRGSAQFFRISTPGTNLSYQWYKDDEPVSGATGDNLSIRDVSIDDMASYHVEVQNSNVPDVTLESKTQALWAYADIEYFPTFSYADGVRDQIEEGEGILLRKTETGPFDTVQVVQVRNRAVLFEDQILGDYLLKVDTDDDYRKLKEYNYSADSIGIDTVVFLPTHYISALEWDSAQTLLLRDYISDTLEMLRIPPPLTAADGDGRIGMFVESDLPGTDSQGNRLEARRRVKKAGCSLRRNTSRSGGRTANEDEEWELIAYAETDDNGEVNFGFLPSGLYRINIQYPGVPMDPDSFIEFEIDEDLEEGGYELAATVFEDGIQVEEKVKLGWYRHYFKELVVYPNPADDYVTIGYAKLNSKDVVYQLANLQGQILKQGQLEKGRHQQHTIDITEMKDGLYILRFYDRARSNRHLQTRKVIIRHGH